ncbi:hypothetical protein [Colwellia sp. UCD-KL20]|uniref:hypothetical protein n=1 Tax=Colwellia sp. UCD-KL20 TaxID=1917165 RepID=UPI00097101EE|nr:hypothetical protein [Colwellia sp. UCD-KL20]
MYKKLLLILALSSLVSCSEKNSQPTAVEKQPDAEKVVSELFESTGSMRGDLTNLITFVNENYGKNESILFELDDYISQKKSAQGLCKAKNYKWKGFIGSFGVFPRIWIQTINGRIGSFTITLPSGVSDSMVSPMLKKHLLENLRNEMFFTQENKNNRSVEFPISYRNGEKRECTTNWYR